MAREDKVADYKTAVGGAVSVDFETYAYLAYHLANGCVGDIGVVWCVAVFGSELRVGVFIIGQVNVDDSFEGAQGVYAFVARGIIYKNWLLAVVSYQFMAYGVDYFVDAVGVMGGGDETD